MQRQPADAQQGDGLDHWTAVGVAALQPRRPPSLRLTVPASTTAAATATASTELEAGPEELTVDTATAVAATVSSGPALSQAGRLSPKNSLRIVPAK